ncbi:MAG: substrate-binding domain-containing protein [Magnetospirillum sp.]|nr:substrate-binding domain-containing protein [Magnetospirillum sp.]
MKKSMVTLIFSLLFAAPLQAETRFITLASTTSTEQSGLFGHLLPLFERDTGIAVRVVAVGTGQALKLGERGDADALLVHDRAGEDRFVAEGFGRDRRDVMHNDFVVVGPTADPAGIKGTRDAARGFGRIAAATAPFASRGDDSGTHRSELRLWTAAGVATVKGDWYRELGSGMGPTLNTAAGMEAYTLADRGTWAGFKNRRGLVIVLEGDAVLFNPYGSILVNHPAAKKAEAQIWHDWLTGPKGQAAIASFRVGGEQVFFPDGK